VLLTLTRLPVPSSGCTAEYKCAEDNVEFGRLTKIKNAFSAADVPELGHYPNLAKFLNAPQQEGVTERKTQRDPVLVCADDTKEDTVQRLQNFLLFVLERTRERFAHDLAFFEACSVFDPDHRTTRSRLFHSVFPALTEHLGDGTWVKHDNSECSSQLLAWLNRGPVKGEGTTITQYWAALLLHDEFAALAAIVLDILALIPTSVICEQIFSHLNRVVTADRTGITTSNMDHKVRLSRDKLLIAGEPEAQHKANKRAIQTYDPGRYSGKRQKMEEYSRAGEMPHTSKVVRKDVLQQTQLVRKRVKTNYRAKRKLQRQADAWARAQGGVQ